MGAGRQRVDRNARMGCMDEGSRFTVGFSVLSSPLVETAWAGLPEALSEQLREWRDATFRRTLRIVMDGYRAGKGER